MHDLINSHLSYKDDTSVHEQELRRKADARKHVCLEIIVREMQVWLSSPTLCDVEHGCVSVSKIGVSGVE